MTLAELKEQTLVLPVSDAHHVELTALFEEAEKGGALTEEVFARIRAIVKEEEDALAADTQDLEETIVLLKSVQKSGESPS